MRGPSQLLIDHISLALERSPHIGCRNHNLRIETEQGHVTLLGVVSSYYQKQMAQEALRRVDGVESIENHLEVNWDTSEGQRASGPESAQRP